MFDERPEKIINYCLQSVIQSVAEKHKDKMIDHKFFKFIDFGNKLKLVRLDPIKGTIEKVYNYSDLPENDKEIRLMLRQASECNGTFLKLRSLGYSIYKYIEEIAELSDYNFEELLEIFSIEYDKLVKNAISENRYDTDCYRNLPNLISQLRDLTIKTNQIKNDDDSSDDMSDDSLIKRYNDYDYASFWYKGYLMVTCSASATHYAIKFDGDDIVIYGQDNSYGYEKELEQDENFDSDLEESYDRLFVKYLNDNYIVYEYRDNVSYFKNDFVTVVASIIEYILKEEQGDSESTASDEDDSISIETIRKKDY